jgi:serine/threonine protein kinase
VCLVAVWDCAQNTATYVFALTVPTRVWQYCYSLFEHQQDRNPCLLKPNSLSVGWYPVTAPYFSVCWQNDDVCSQKPAVCVQSLQCKCLPAAAAHAGVITSPQEFIAMLEQMVGCQYEIPDSFGLSEDCKDLLRRMLMPEPHKRISTEDILAHRWFNTNLPPEAATMNDRCLQLAPLPGVPDPETIRQIVHTATSGGGSSSFAGTSSLAAAGAGSGGPSKGSGYSSGTQMHGTSGHKQQQQQGSACTPTMQQVTPQQQAQMVWAQQQQQQQQAGAHAGHYDTQQHAHLQAQPHQGQQQPYQQYM